MDLLTVDEVAEMLKLSKYTIYEKIKAGDIKAFKVGRKIRITEDDLKEYIESCRTVAV